MKCKNLSHILFTILALCVSLSAAGPANGSPSRVAHAAHIGSGTSPASTQTTIPAALPAASNWYTYANGDDVLALEMEGDILWAGTRAGGVMRWDTTAGTFVQFLAPQDKLAGNTVRDIYIDADGHKWFATDQGLSVLDDQGTADKTDDEWHTFTYWAIGGYLPSNRITAVAMDEAGFLWVGTSQRWGTELEKYVGGGLVKIDTQGTLTPADDRWVQTYTISNTISHRRDEVILGLASDNITDILPVPGNRVWIATWRHWDFRTSGFDDDPGQWLQVYGGLSRLDHAGTPKTDDDAWQTWTCEAGPQWHRAISCIINQLKLDDNGYVWAAMRGRGVIAFPADIDRWLDYVWFRRSDGLASDGVAAIAFGPADDSQWRNTVWFGTYDASRGYGRGVCVLDHRGTIADKDDDVWNSLSATGDCLTTDTGLADDRVQALVVGNDKVWMGAGGTYGAGHGITSFDLARQTFGEALLTGRSGLPYNYITDLAVGRWSTGSGMARGHPRCSSTTAGSRPLPPMPTERCGPARRGVAWTGTPTAKKMSIWLVVLPVA